MGKNRTKSDLYHVAVPDENSNKKKHEWKHASVLGVILSRYFLNTCQLYIFMGSISTLQADVVTWQMSLTRYLGELLKHIHLASYSILCACETYGFTFPRHFIFGKTTGSLYIKKKNKKKSVFRWYDFIHSHKLHFSDRDISKDMSHNLIRGMVGEKEKIDVTRAGYMEQKIDRVVQA